jgi:tRNA threonylcarbamoyladenosine modification (KEOPS) complex Cgi121 subunit
VETILYASAVRQIQKAIRLLGIKPSTASAAIVVFGETREEVAGLLDEVSRYLDTAPDDAVLELDEVKAAKIREAFNIADQELRTVSKSSDSNVALVSLVVERVALLATQL